MNFFSTEFHSLVVSLKPAVYSHSLEYTTLSSLGAQSYLLVIQFQKSHSVLINFAPPVGVEVVASNNNQ
jgi:hypothetical protein